MLTFSLTLEYLSLTDTLRKLGGRLSCRLRLSTIIVPSCMPLGSTSFCTKSQIVVEPNIKLNK